MGDDWGGERIAGTVVESSVEGNAGDGEGLAGTAVESLVEASAGEGITGTVVESSVESGAGVVAAGLARLDVVGDPLRRVISSWATQPSVRRS